MVESPTAAMNCMLEWKERNKRLFTAKRNVIRTDRTYFLIGFLDVLKYVINNKIV
jgi:hypothetical protein